MSAHILHPDEEEEEEKEGKVRKRRKRKKRRKMWRRRTTSVGERRSSQGNIYNFLHPKGGDVGFI